MTASSKYANIQIGSFHKLIHTKHPHWVEVCWPVTWWCDDRILPLIWTVELRDGTEHHTVSAAEPSTPPSSPTDGMGKPERPSLAPAQPVRTRSLQRGRTSESGPHSARAPRQFHSGWFFGLPTSHLSSEPVLDLRRASAWGLRPQPQLWDPCEHGTSSPPNSTERTDQSSL